LSPKPHPRPSPKPLVGQKFIVDERRSKTSRNVRNSSCRLRRDESGTKRSFSRTIERTAFYPRTLQIIHSSFRLDGTELVDVHRDALGYSENPARRRARIQLVSGFLRQCRAREIIALALTETPARKRGYDSTAKPSFAGSRAAPFARTKPQSRFRCIRSRAASPARCRRMRIKSREMYVRRIIGQVF